MSLKRRQVLLAGLAGTSASLVGCASVATGGAPLGRVVVIGGGFGGATAAKYIRLWEPRIEVTLVERAPSFVSCPISNLVLSGDQQLADITVPYAGLARHGVRVVQDEATHIDLEKKQVRLARGDALPYDRLVVAPGIDFQFEKIPGLQQAHQAGVALHAWKAGAETVALRAQLQALPDGGVFAISIPKAPYRCPPGPYERASLVAHYFKQHKPRSKVLILDANPDIVSKKGLFLKAWSELYPGIVEYRPNAEVVEFDLRGKVAKGQVEDYKADLFNIIQPQQAGRIAQPLVSVNNQWVGVEFQTWEAAKAPGVHVIGDAIAAAPGMPKSGFMANNHGKVVADAVVARLSGQAVNEAPIIANTCYSFVSPREVVHVASVHKWNAEQKTLVPVPGAGGLSSARNELEGRLPALQLAFHQRAAQRPGAVARGDVDVAGIAQIEQARAPALRPGQRGAGGQPGVVAAGHHGDLAQRGALLQLRRHAVALGVGRGHQQRRHHATARAGLRACSQVLQQRQAAVAVGHRQPGAGRLVGQGVLDARSPVVQAGLGPMVLLHAHGAAVALLQPGLPVAGAAVMQTGNDQQSQRRACGAAAHGGSSSRHLGDEKKGPTDSPSR